MTDYFKALAQHFAAASPAVRDDIYDFRWYIEDKTQGFVGREFVFDAIKRFIEDNPQGYFRVRGDPGIGKSALAAQLVKYQGYLHHFNIRAMGINNADLFLRNICAQLIARYQLNRTILPPGAVQDGGFLITLLAEISQKLGPSEKVIIVVDALDETEDSILAPGANVLYLPVTLPRGVYFIVTTRKAAIRLHTSDEPHSSPLDIEHDSQGNIADIRKYVEQALARSGIQAYITALNITEVVFVEHLVGKSEGNFMYLRYVLPEIEKGAYRNLMLDALPKGLQNYYEDHWRRMRGRDLEAWFEYKLPVLLALAAAEYSVSIEMIMDFSRVQERRRVVSVLQEEEWGQFLHKEEVPFEGSTQKRYSLYHASFQEFLAKKDEVEEGINFMGARVNITDSLTSELFGGAE